MQTILLTGATGGLGQALADRILKEDLGALVCIYRNEEKFRRLFGARASQVRPYCMTAGEDYGRLSALLQEIPSEEVSLILNAFSIAPIQRIGAYTMGEMEQMIHGNILQNVVLINAVVRFCRQEGRKLRIINLDSGAADMALSGWGGYCAAKAYLNAFLAVAALENPAWKFVSFDPGVMDTGMQKQIRETDRQIFDQVEDFVGYKETGRLNKPSDVANELTERYLLAWKACAFRECFGE